VDDIESVINKLIDHYKMPGAPSALPAPSSLSKPLPGPTPDLTHTKLLSAEIAGQPLKKVDWNALLIAIVEVAASKSAPGQEVAELVIANRVVGPKTNNGYRYIPSANISVQGTDTNGCWKAVAHLANKLNIPVKASYRWYDNEKAAKPNETGYLSLNAE
jgi:hypothetical protein